MTVNTSRYVRLKPARAQTSSLRFGGLDAASVFTSLARELLTGQVRASQLACIIFKCFQLKILHIAPSRWSINLLNSLTQFKQDQNIIFLTCIKVLWHHLYNHVQHVAVYIVSYHSTDVSIRHPAWFKQTQSKMFGFIIRWDAEQQFDPVCQWKGKLSHFYLE